jgi:hypothetical protein
MDVYNIALYYWPGAQQVILCPPNQRASQQVILCPPGLNSTGFCYCYCYSILLLLLLLLLAHSNISLTSCLAAKILTSN